MKKISSFFIVTLFLLFILSGCSSLGITNKPKKSIPIFMVWKSKGMKFADQGFLIDNHSSTKFQIYSSGQAVADISISKKAICAGILCMSKKEFNDKYLSKYYPETLLENVLYGRKIFGGKNLKNEKEGFSQTIKNDKVDIKYIVNGNDIGFKDDKNNITIIIKKG